MKLPGPRAREAVLLASCLLIAAARIAAQEPSAPGLVFGDNGRVLHAFGKDRLITYDAGTGVATRIVNLQPHSQVLSVTSEGRTAIIAEGTGSISIHEVMMDMETGHAQDIPLSYGPRGDPATQISGDGRLISIFSGNGPQMTVTVYDWIAKALVVKRTSAFFGAGGSFGGGVTVDGAVEFTNNRVGRKVVDLMTGRLMGWFNPYSFRSSDGAWVVEFPNVWAEFPPKDVIIKDGRNGQTRGKLVGVQVEIKEGTVEDQDGAFCGASGRFVLSLKGSVAVYAIPTGNLLMTFPERTWQDPNTTSEAPASVACSSDGTRVAVLSGSRLTFHALK